MVVWQECHVDITAAQVLGQLQGVNVVHQVVMGQQYRLGQGSGTGGEQNNLVFKRINRQAQVFLKTFLQQLLTFFSQLRNAHVAFQLIHADVFGNLGLAFCLQSFDVRNLCRFEDQDVGVASHQGAFQFFVRQSLIQRYGVTQTAQCGKMGLHPFHTVLADGGNSLAFHASLQQGGAQLVDMIPEFLESNVLIGHFLSVLMLYDERRVAAVGLRSIAEQFTQVFMSFCLETRLQFL